jgi:hypothetical protein
MRVDWVLLDSFGEEEVEAGDLVSVEAGGAPTLRVIRIDDSGRAWLRDEAHQMDMVAPITQFHWKAHFYAM